MLQHDDQATSCQANLLVWNRDQMAFSVCRRVACPNGSGAPNRCGLEA